MLVTDEGSFELVDKSNDWQSGYYGKKIEDIFTKYHKDGNAWVATSREGISYYFGSTTDSRQDNTEGVFQWCLDRVVDTNGNYITFEYQKDQGQIYIDRIEYTGNSSLTPSNSIQFYYETYSYAYWPWNNKPPVSYLTHFSVATALRLCTIKINSYDGLVRLYKLYYHQSGQSQQIELASVKEFGSDSLLDGDSIISGSTLPPVEISYHPEADALLEEGYVCDVDETIANEPDDSFISFADMNGDGKKEVIYSPEETKDFIAIFPGNSTSTRKITWGSRNFDPSPETATNGFVDFNGDGKTDYIYVPDGTNELKKLISTDNGFETEAPAGTILNTLNPLPLHNKAQWFADVNGDGMADFIYDHWRRIDFLHIIHEYWVKLSNGDTFEPDVKWAESPGLPFLNGFVGLADMNGDGMADIVLCSWHDVWVFVSTGDGFSPGSIWGAAESLIPRFVRFSDLNGDGMMDFLYFDDTELRVMLSKGNSFDEDTKWAQGSKFTDARFWFADMNGDGMTDLFYNFFGDDELNVKLSTGTRFTENVFTNDEVWGTKSHSIGSSEVVWGVSDFSGDGKADFIYRSNRFFYHPLYVMYSQKSQNMCLSSLSNGKGATWSVAYEPSSAYKNRTLPGILQTVSSITVDDGIGTPAVTSFTYGDGYYFAPDREFRGFGWAEQTNPDGSTLKTTFIQDDAFLKGKINKICHTEPNQGDVLSEVTIAWNKSFLNDPEQNAAFVWPDQKETKYDNNQTDSKEEYTYDTTNGFLTKVIISGTRAPSFSIENEYDDTFGVWLWRQTQVVIKDENDLTVRRTDFVYENGTGNLLQELRYLDGQNDPTISKGYDIYGNSTSVTDARGNPTYTEYDSVTQTYSVRITYPQTGGITHEIEKSWDHRFGEIATLTDENENVTEYNYDPFGRIEIIDYPDSGQTLFEYTDTDVPRHTLKKSKRNLSRPDSRYIYLCRRAGQADTTCNTW